MRAAFNGGVWLIAVFFVLSHVVAAAERPNIVVFLVDDMGVMDTSVAFLTDADGKPQRHPLNDFYRTPSMERLAARGVRFSQFYAMSVCSPTRVSLMTGQNSARHHVTNWINPHQNNRGPFGPPDWRWRGLDEQSITLPRLLKSAGYRTIHVGKGHFGPEGTPGADPRNVGFDVNVGGRSIGQPATYYGEKNYGNGPKPAANAVPHLESYHGTSTFLSDALTLEAQRHVQEAIDKKQPFFLNLAHYAVHAPFDSDPRFASHYRESGKPPAAQAFATLIEGMDKSLGDLLDFLEARKVAENTLIIFMGDNGSDAPLGGPHDVASSAPLRGRKGSHYEGGMRVPCIVAWAKPSRSSDVQQRLPIMAGAIERQFGAVYDVFPTLLHVAGIESPKEHAVDGVDLESLLIGRQEETRSQTFLMHYPHSPHRSDYFTVFRDGRWKLIFHYEPASMPRAARWQLFDLESDPYEADDLSAKQPKRVRSMGQAMLDRLRAQGAQFPVAKDGQELLPLTP